MTALLLVSIGLVGLGIAGSLTLLVRSGEIRVGFLTLGFALLGARQGVELWTLPSAPLGFDLAGGSEIALAAAALAGLGALAAVWRTLQERDRAEALHWDSMEAVRVLGELAVRWDLTLDEKLSHILTIGCERLGTAVGSVSRIDGQRYEVIAIRAPEDVRVERGAVFLLADTLCGLTFDAKRLVALENVAAKARPAHAERAPFGFASYIGAPVRIFGEPVGTLCFGSATPRRRRFTATDKDFANLMALWVGTELERRLLAEEREAIGVRQSALAEGPPREAQVARSVDVNLAIRRSEKNLRSLVGPGVEIAFDLAGDLARAVRLHVTIGAILESLAHHAAEALSGAGTLTVTTRNLEVAHHDPHVVPAVAPDHYVTVGVKIAGADIDAESMSDGFDAAGTRPERTGRIDLEQHLTIAAIYRLLQRSGGDLSLAVETGVEATFTVYLPRATAASRKERAATGADSPTPPA